MNWEITEYRIDFRYINIKKQGINAHSKHSVNPV